jgi:hypothetical protein
MSFTIDRFNPRNTMDRNHLNLQKPMKTLPFQWMLALAASLAASAQPPQQQQRGERRPSPVPPFFAFFDADHDRLLSAEEIKAASDALGKLDRNGDGEITLDEFRMPPPDGRREREKKQKNPPPVRPPVPPVIAALDSDKDGTISPAELEAAPESLKALDKDGDGTLSPEELRPFGPPPPRDDGGQPQGPPPEDSGGVE